MLVITPVSLFVLVSCNFSFDGQCPVTKEPNSHIQTHPALGCGTKPLHLPLPHSRVTISPVQPTPGAVWPELCGQHSVPRTNDAVPSRGTAPGPSQPVCPSPLCPVPGVLGPAPSPSRGQACSVPFSAGLQERFPPGCRSTALSPRDRGLGFRSSLLPFPPAGGCVSSRLRLKRLTRTIYLREGLFSALSCC